jgi:hypothetical protein
MIYTVCQQDVFALLLPVVDKSGTTGRTPFSKARTPFSKAMRTPFSNAKTTFSNART